MSALSRLVCISPRVLLSPKGEWSGLCRQFRSKSKPSINSTKSKSEPVEKVFTPHSSPETTLPKYFVYTALVVPTTFVGCIIWQYENFRSQAQRFRRHPRPAQKEFGMRDHVNGIWNQLSPGRKMIVGIIAVNTMIFGLWRVPALSHTMNRYFMCMPTKAYSVLSSTLSGFSHQGGFHLFANMYVVWSFSGALLQILNHEQLMALYISGITVSSLASSVFKVVSGRMIPSIGASGGVLALVAYVCYSLPDSRISIAFIDQIIPHSFTASSAILGVIALDIAGLVMGWKLLDHAGHLGGTLFGLLYAAYGNSAVWVNYRKKILKRWHQIRNSGSES